MTKNLSRWDLIDEFTAQQAACLMLGMDPNDPKASTWETEPILIRMRESYQRTAIGIVFKLREDDSNPEGVKMVGDFMELMGRRLSFFYFETERQAEDVRQADDVITRLSGWFDQETFRRPELVRWLSLFQIQSQYQFDLDAVPENFTEPSVTHKPKMRLQEDWVIEQIKARGFDPTNLPESTAKGGVRSLAWATASHEKKLFPSKSTFDHTWQRLRDDNRIMGGELAKK